MTLLLVQKDPRLGKCFTKKTTQKNLSGLRYGLNQIPPLQLPSFSTPLCLHVLIN